jgi:uncharacterized phage-like protein YoqJ
MINETAHFTGHRWQDLNGKDPQDNFELLVHSRNIVIDLIENHGVTRFYSGMAIGYDLWMAKIIIALRRDHYPHIKLLCAIPCKGQWEAWVDYNPEDVYEWMKVYEEADEIEYVYDGRYEKWVLPNRNTYMVARSAYAIAAWNEKESGGTFDCLTKARKKGRMITRINPKTNEIIKENW